MKELFIMFQKEDINNEDLIKVVQVINKRVEIDQDAQNEFLFSLCKLYYLKEEREQCVFKLNE